MTLDELEFIRQQWRMWIETRSGNCVCARRANSFASNGECGLKHECNSFVNRNCKNSFASNGECGLKQRLSQASEAFW